MRRQKCVDLPAFCGVHRNLHRWVENAGIYPRILQIFESCSLRSMKPWFSQFFLFLGGLVGVFGTMLPARLGDSARWTPVSTLKLPPRTPTQDSRAHSPLAPARSHGTTIKSLTHVPSRTMNRHVTSSINPLKSRAQPGLKDMRLLGLALRLPVPAMKLRGKGTARRVSGVRGPFRDRFQDLLRQTLANLFFVANDNDPAFCEVVGM